LKSDNKDSVLEEIALLIGAPVRKTMRGGTVPRAFLDDVASVLNVSAEGNKNVVFQRCVDTLGLKWQPHWDSRDSPSGGGGTITTVGLEALRDALIDFSNHEDFSSGSIGVFAPTLENTIAGYILAPEKYNHEGEFAPSEIDPDKIEDGFERHNKAQNMLAEFLDDKDCRVSSPSTTDPKFDLHWSGSNGSYVCEVKSITDENEESQLRKAIGQVLRYQSQLRASGKECFPVVVTDREVSDQSWYSVFSENGMTLSSAPKFNGIELLT